MKMTLAQSALNRLLNFVDELEAPAAEGAALDAVLAAPVPEMPAAEGLEEALVKKGLGLEPPP